MKYRVEVDVSFVNERDAIALLNMVEGFKAKVFEDAVSLSATKTLQLDRNCRYHECYHDEDPPKPCGDYKCVDFDGIDKDWTTK